MVRQGALRKGAIPNEQAINAVMVKNSAVRLT
jgi:hypothetical protein